MKVCKKCKKNKERDEYYTYNGGINLRGTCITCYNVREVYVDITEKRCCKCKSVKDISKFYKNKLSKDRYNSNCIKCSEVKSSNYNISKYGLTKLEYTELLDSQDFKCAICNETNGDHTRLFIDHDHNTGKVRGLLCHTCNAGLGMFKDSTMLLLVAATYLEQNK